MSATAEPTEIGAELRTYSVGESTSPDTILTELEVSNEGLVTQTARHIFNCMVVPAKKLNL